MAERKRGRAAMGDGRCVKRLRLMVDDGGQCPPHLGFLEGFCIRCGERERGGDHDDGSTMVAFEYIRRTLKLSPSGTDELRRSSVRQLTHARKLVLVLDLDHTLLHTTCPDKLSGDEEYLLTSTMENLHRVDSMGYITKLRPFVHAFLEEASKYFKMYVYTMGKWSYAQEMAKLLDPGNAFFKSKLISREDSTTPGYKDLDVVLADERLVVILDDTDYVWRRHTRNLMHMQSYDFFASNCSNLCFGDKSLSEMNMDESESDGSLLANTLDVLKRVHETVFDPVLGVDLSSRNVPQVLQKMRREIFRGCKIVFSQTELHPMWQLAEKLGATRSLEIDASVTHVVSGSAESSTARWAVQHNKFLVTPDWITAAYYLWKRPSEKDFVPPAVSLGDVPAAPGCVSAASLPVVRG